MNSSTNHDDEQVVDIIIPVYRGLEETLACIDSVLDSKLQNTTSMNIIVINDASPEPELVEQLKTYDTRLTLLHNAENLGFVATVNRGMSQTNNDVVLLNSDAEVANNWLDRLVAHTERAAFGQVATVTPYANNATLCSYPIPFADNELPRGETVATMDRLCVKANLGEAVVIPTGVGFCLMITRRALNQVGLFDVEAFGRGYGEENDFCLRAEQHGFVNLHALDVFAWHKGGVSFSADALALQNTAIQIIRQRYPQFEATVERFKQADKTRMARLKIALAAIDEPAVLIFCGNLAEYKEKILRFQQSESPVILVAELDGILRIHVLGKAHPIELIWQREADETEQVMTLLSQLSYKKCFRSAVSELPAFFADSCSDEKQAILHVVNHHGGGTLRYVESLAYHPDSRFRHFILYVNEEQQVLFDVLNNCYQPLNLYQDAQWHSDVLMQLLARYDCAVGLHLHSMVGAALDVSESLVSRLPFVVTLHDHYFLSDTAFEQSSITPSRNHVERIQQLLRQANQIITPSRYLLRQAEPYFSADKLCCIAHGVDAEHRRLTDETADLAQALMQQATWDNNKSTIAVVGAIGPHKGMDYWKELQQQFHRNDYQFVHIGYCADGIVPLTKKGYIQHGAYHHSEVSGLLAAYHVDLVLFLPGIPESFCYALSDVYGRLPVLLPNVGAFTERVAADSCYPINLSSEKLRNMIIERLSTPFQSQHSTENQSLTTMVSDTEQYYTCADNETLPTFNQQAVNRFLSENLNEETFKASMVHLSRENYFLRTTESRLQDELTTLAEDNQALREHLTHYSNDIATLNAEIQRLTEGASVKQLGNRIYYGVKAKIKYYLGRLLGR